jgi:ubiquinone biosynthesis protein
MVFAHRFFHADPHAGNVFVEMDGRVAFVDFGMVGSVTAHTGRGLGTILLALVATDPTKMADGLLRLGVASDDVNRTTLERDLAQFLAKYARLPLEQLHLGPLIAELMSVVRAHRLRLPSDLALLLKTVMMCEGVAAQLDPTFELIPNLLPYAARLASDDTT